MDWKTLDIDLDRIDLDNSTYRITTDHAIEPLIASIGALGLLHPPFILPAENRTYMVVSGFKRVAACRHLGHAKIRTRLLKPGPPPERPAEIAIGDNALQRPLNLVETSRALTLLAGHIQDPSAMEQICRRLGLPLHLSMQNKIKQLCRMPTVLQQGILDEDISLNTALMLDELGMETGVILAGIFRDLHLSHSKQREILTHIDEIARRDKIAPLELLDETSLKGILSDPETSRVQKGTMLRHYFKSKRFPFLTLFEEKFQQESKKLSLGDKVQMKAPAGFESREYVFTVNIKTLSDLQTGIETLQNTVANPAMKNILTLKTSCSA